MRPPQTGGFTLLEVIVSVAILLMLLSILAAVIALVSPALKTSGNGIASFQQARAGFEALTQNLSQATLTTYWDYVDSNGNFRTPSNTSTFVPAGFARASQLHFISGWATSKPQGQYSGGTTLVPGGSASTTPGDAIFFQAPLGRSITSTYQPLDSSLNEVGFYVQFSDDTNDWPSFVKSSLGTNYRFRLMEWVPQTQNLGIYASTFQTSSATPYPNIYDLQWVTQCLPTIGSSPGTATLTTTVAGSAGSVTLQQDAPRVLAENVVLLIMLPKLTPQDETNLANESGYTPGTLLCPNYQYDSRAWETAGISPYVTTGSASSGVGAVLSGKFGGSNYSLVSLMKNQLPPLVEVVMIAISDSDAQRLQKIHGTTLPPELTVSSTAFQTSANLASDVQAYETQLNSHHITYKTFSTTVQIKGAKWSLN